MSATGRCEPLAAPQSLRQVHPSPAAKEWVKTLATDKEEYTRVVTSGCLKLVEVLVDKLPICSTT